MTKINQLAALADKHQLEDVELNIISIDKETDGQYGKNFRCRVSDETGSTSCNFAGIKNHDVHGWVGKKVLFKSVRNQGGQLCSIRTDKNGNYTNIYITNSVKATVAGAATISHTNPLPPDVKLPPRPEIPPELLAKHIAQEWAAVYEWTHEIFEKVLPEGTPCRECVTSVVISMNRMGVQILPPVEPPKKPWRDVIFKEIPLGSWEPERIRKALVKLLQGAQVGQEIATALLDAAEEPEFSPMNLFGQMIVDAGLDDDDVNVVLLRDYKSLDSLDGASVREIVINGKAFIEECQKVAAAKPSVVDQIDV